jgi:diguanylate cyclase (GGDEF)-like protein
MSPGQQVFAAANLTLALSILALTLSSFRSGRRPRHARSWVFFGAASGTLVAYTALQAVDAPLLAAAPFQLATTALLAIGFVLLYGADQEQLGRIEDEARRDALTGLYNLRAFRALATERLAEARDRGTGCAVAILDLDGFKTLNDTRGHLVGDRVLRLVGHAVGANLRGRDVAARYGGDEFVLLLDRCDASEAHRIVERIRASVSALTAAGGGPVSASGGIAGSEENGADLEGLIAAADAALLRAKRAGKDDVLVALASA